MPLSPHFLLPSIAGLLLPAVDDPPPPQIAAPCAQPGVVWYAPGLLPISDDLVIAGVNGSIDITFTSATPLIWVLAALKTFEQLLGVAADLDDTNPSRIRLSSLGTGADAFVSVKKISESQPNLFTSPTGGRPLLNATDTGEDGNPGDLDCDASVTETDLAILLQAWGSIEPGEPADLNLDGAVDGVDLGLLLSVWGV